MNNLNLFSRILSCFLILSISGCASVNLSVGGVKTAMLSSSQNANARQAGNWLPQRQPNINKETAFRHSLIQAQTVNASTYWTGNSGKGMSITILPPRGVGLAKDQAYLPDLVANELVSNFSKFSAMSLFDRVNNQRQYDELLSGYYADNDKAGLDLGHLASTDYMLLGNITRTSTGYVLQLTVNRNSDKTTVATYSGAVSIVELDNLIGIRRASIDMLPKIGVQITSQAREELNRAAAIDHVNALTAMAQGINAQRQGTEVAALTYFFQAAAFDASLTEAISRTNVLSANISTGNIGANVRNDFAWYDSWKSKLIETETYINDMLRNTSPQRSIWYTNNIIEQESARDVERRTTELRIEAVLHTHAAFPASVQKTVQAVYDGLKTTGRTEAWKLDGWPRQGVTKDNPFNNRWGNMISIAFEVLNERNQVIGKQTIEMDSRFSFYGTSLDGPGTVFATVRFTGVRGADITDNLSIRIASINGRPPAEAGISRIEPMSAEQMQANRNFTIYNGAIRPNSNDRNLSTITIPAELWGERVISIANKAFEGRRLTSVTISNGITTIEERAFADNHWTSNDSHQGLSRIIIPNSVTSIGKEAFASHWVTSRYDSSSGKSYTYNHWLVTEVTIGANVSLGENAIGNGFETSYANGGKKAGVYNTKWTDSGRWSYRTPEQAQTDAQEEADEAGMGIGGVMLRLLFLGAVITGGVLIYKYVNKDK